MNPAEIYKKNNIYMGGPITLSGLAAVGKTTIGKSLSKKLGVPFIDLDDEISKKAGKKTTKEVIANLGHAAFKQLQYECLKKIVTTTKGRYILAAGGEIARPGYDADLVKKNRALINKYTYNIVLMPSDNKDDIVKTLYPRLNDGKRDIRTKNRDEFATYVEPAIQAYIDLGDLVIFTHNAEPEEITTILQKQVTNKGMPLSLPLHKTIEVILSIFLVLTTLTVVPGIFEYPYNILGVPTQQMRIVGRVSIVLIALFTILLIFDGLFKSKKDSSKIAILFLFLFELYLYAVSFGMTFYNYACGC